MSIVNVPPSMEPSSERRLSRIIGGGLVALFCTLFIAALSLFGVLNVTLGHVCMFLAWAVGGILVSTEIIPGKPVRHKVVWIIGLAAFMLAADVGIVHLRPVPNSPEYADGRTLEEWQRVRLVAILSQYPSQKVTILASAGKETFAYADQFRDVFKDSKWRVDGPKPAPVDQPAVDLQVSVSHKYFGNEAAMPPGFQALKSGVDFLGLKSRHNFIMDPDINPDLVVLWVGPKSPDGMSPDNYPPLVVHGQH